MRLQKINIALILCDTDDLFVRADFHADRMIDNSVSGVIFVPTAVSNAQNQIIIDKLNKNNIPVVLVDRTYTVYGNWIV